MKKLLAITLVLLAVSIKSQTIILSEDFESGTLNGFASNTTAGSLMWQTTTNRDTDSGHSTSNSAYFGDPVLFDYNTGVQEAAELTSPVINLSGYTYVSLTLNYFLQTENAGGFDVAAVEVSTDGLTYTTLASNSGVGLTLVDGSGSWQVLTADLSSYVGGNVYLRFSFNTVDNFANAFEGFYIDDIEISGIGPNSSFMYNKTIGTVGNELIRGASQDNAGGLVLVGDYNAPIQNSIVIKTNFMGDTVWTKNLINYAQSPYSLGNITQTPDGGYIASGVVGGGGGSGAVGTQDMCVFKLDNSGNYSWCKGYGDNDFTEDVNSAGIKLISGNNMLLYGKVTRLVGGSFTTTEPAIMKLNSAGDTLWTSAFEYKYTDLIDVVELSNGDIVVVGGNNGSTWSTIYYLDGNGNSVWTTDIWMDTIVKVKETSSGNLLFCGGDIQFGNDMNAALLSLDFSGNFLFSDRYGSSNHSEIGKDIIETQDGGYAMIVADNSTGYQKFGLYKLDASRNLEWARAYGGNLPSDPVFVIQYPVGDYVIAGYTKAFGRGLADAYLVRTNSMGITVGCQEELTNVQRSSFIESYSTYAFNVLRGAVYGNFSGVVSFYKPTTLDVYSTTSVTSNNPLCYGGDGSAIVNVNGGVNPFTYLWSSGIASQTLTGAPAGTYSVIVTGNDGCVVHDTVTLTEPTPITASLVATDVDCFANFNGAVDLTVSGGTPGYTFQWANGDTTEDISGVGGGFYQVTITDANGCQFLKGKTVLEPGPLNAGINNTQNASCFGLCDGSAVAIANGGTSPYTYLWNDTQAQTGQTATNLCEGSYLVTVTDNNNCTAFANTIIGEPDQLMASVSTTPSECGASIGTADAIVTGGTGSMNYSWSSGGAASTESGLSPGNYSVDITDANGCAITENFAIGSNTASIEICVVTVDSLNRNTIVWEKPVATNIQGFYIYRNIAGAYSQIGYQPYDSISQYVDNSFGVDPTITSYRYEISVLDSCGNESTLSNFHETIHLTSNLGINGEVNLIWDNYEGFVFTQYNILRDSTGLGNWEIIATVPNTNFTYTDLTPPQSGSLRYIAEVVLPATCSATKAQDHNSTRSNQSTAVAPGGNTGTSIEELILSQANVYPNPNNGFVTIEVKSASWKYELFDLGGKLLLEENMNEMTKSLGLTQIETGIYLMKISIDNEFIFKKISKL